MTTAEEIFTMAIHLMDQQNDATGAAAGREVAVYRTRALSVLNGILPALRPFSDTGPEGRGGLPVRPSQPSLRRSRWTMPWPGGAALRPGGPPPGRGRIRT